MNSYFQEYATVAVLLAVGIIFMLALTSVAALLRPNNPSKEKLTTYESGVDPVGTGWSQTYIRYYIFGLLFVIFDVEAVFIFPWAINLEKLGYFGLVEMLVFIFILLIGLIYAIRKDVLKWEYWTNLVYQNQYLQY